MGIYIILCLEEAGQVIEFPNEEKITIEQLCHKPNKHKETWTTFISNKGESK